MNSTNTIAYSDNFETMGEINPDKKLEKNSDPPIINPIIREGKKVL